MNIKNELETLQMVINQALQRGGIPDIATAKATIDSFYSLDAKFNEQQEAIKQLAVSESKEVSAAIAQKFIGEPLKSEIVGDASSSK